MTSNPLDWQVQRVRHYLRWTDSDLAKLLRGLADRPDHMDPHDRVAFLVAVAERLDPAISYGAAEYVLTIIEQRPRLPITRDYLATLTGMDRDEVAKIADQLAREGRIERTRTRDGAHSRSERLVAYHRKEARDDS